MPCRRAPASPPEAEEPLPGRTRSEVGATAPRSPCLPITRMRSRRAPWPLDHPGRGAKAHSRRARELTARLLAPVVTRAQLTRRAYALVSAHIRGIVCLSSAEVRPDNVRDGSALSDGSGPASTDEKAYERNRCLKPRKSRAGSNLTDRGRCAARGRYRWCGAGLLRSRFVGPVGRPRRRTAA